MDSREVETQHFRLVLPQGDWSDRSDVESFDFCREDSEQVVAIVHVARTRLKSKQLLDSVTALLKHRLNALQQHSGNACQFESPILADLSRNCVVRVVGCDTKNCVLLQLGLFGTPEKVVVVSHYDYTGASAVEDFKRRSDELFASVQVR